MNKHTPGPWFADEDGWIKGGDGEVIEYAGCGSHEAYWNKQEDKALVLAAPDLLDALERMVKCAQKQNWNDHYPEELAASYLAIDRARGEA